jgi:serine/threonine protein kinase
MAEANSTIFATKYEILKKLGQGGFASVYLAKDTTLGFWLQVKQGKELSNRKVNINFAKMG